MTTPTGSLRPGARIHDRYEVVRQIGRGGMGAVYEALVPELETPSSDYADILLDFGQEGRGDGFFDDPRSIASGPDGAIYVADFWSNIQIFAADGNPLGAIKLSGSVRDLTFDNAN